MLVLTVPPQELTVVRTQQAPKPLAQVPSIVPFRPTHSEVDMQTPSSSSAKELKINIEMGRSSAVAAWLQGRHIWMMD